MENLNEYIHKIEKIAVNIKDLKNNLLEIENIIINIINEEENIISRIKEEKNSALKEEYGNWLNKNHSYLIWLLKIINEYKEKEITGDSKDIEMDVKHLVEFLTKYHSIENKVTKETIIKKIEKQINDLYKDIFKTKSILIKSEDEITEERKDKIKEEPKLEEQEVNVEETISNEFKNKLIDVIQNNKYLDEELIKKYNGNLVDAKENFETFIDINNQEEKVNKKSKRLIIEPFFKEDEKISINSIKKTITDYATITNNTVDDLEKEIFPKLKKRDNDSNNLGKEYLIGNEIKVKLNAKCEKDNIKRNTMFPPNLKRTVNRLKLINGKIIDSNIELEKNRHLEIKSVECKINDIIEGWYEIHELK